MSHAAITAIRRARQRGSAMIEMALVLPVYFMLVFGMVQLCFILFGYCNATYASRQAARYAAVHGTGATYTCTSTDIQNVALQYLWGAPKNGVTISTSWPDTTTNNPNNYVTVTISLVYPTGIPFSKISSIVVGTSATAWILQ
jgi:Flp pilus assembly protein TadG